MTKQKHQVRSNQTTCPQTVLVFFWASKSSRKLMASVALGFSCVQECGIPAPVLGGAAQNLSAALLATALILP